MSAQLLNVYAIILDFAFQFNTLEEKVSFNSTCVANSGVGECQDYANLACGSTGYCECITTAYYYNYYYQACCKYSIFCFIICMCLMLVYFIKVPRASHDQDCSDGTQCAFSTRKYLFRQS